MAQPTGSSTSVTSSSAAESAPSTSTPLQGQKSVSTSAGLGINQMAIGPTLGQNQGPSPGQVGATTHNQGQVPDQSQTPGPPHVQGVIRPGPNQGMRPAGLIPGGPGHLPGPQHIG